MIKRIFAAVVCLMFALCLPGFAQMASQGYDTQALERYSSFAEDGSTGEWSVSDPLFEAAVDSVRAGEAKNSMKDGFVLFQMRLSGNSQTGTLRPEMEIDYVANKPIGVRAVSILAGGMRYDFRAQGVSASVGGYPAEQIVLPMADISAAQAIASAEEMTVLLHGARGVYETQISLHDEAKTAKDRLESTSLRCDSLLGELDGLNIEAYSLWDLSAAEWQAALGFEPECIAAEADAMNMIVPGDKGGNVEALQEMLAAAGFYAGAAEKEYDSKTAEAVARAQAYYGLLVTGSADETLIAALTSGTAPAAKEEAEAGREMTAVGEIELCIDRWWQAGRVNASAAGEAPASLVCSDGSNVFAVCEGRIRNMSGAEIGLGWELTGEMIVNGTARFACTLRAEADNGASFASSLLPLAESRLIVLAEVPAGALDMAETAVVVITDGTNTMEYSLIG